jgi:hypothetical protein
MKQLLILLQGDSGILSQLLLEQYYDEQPLQIVLHLYEPN